MNVDQYLMTMVKLTDANKMALNRWGDRDQSSLADALFHASMCVDSTDTTCSIQLCPEFAHRKVIRKPSTLFKRSIPDLMRLV